MQRKTKHNPINRFTTVFGLLSVCFAIAIVSSCRTHPASPKRNTAAKRPVPADAWKAPDTSAIPHDEAGDMIRYGRELLANTGKYFGPNGSIAHISNGMNCQNCHLDGGTRLFGNNYSLAVSTYPKWNDRSGKLQPLTQRFYDCFSRSLAGKVPDTNGREIRAMIAYMKWLGQGVKKGQKVFGAGSEKLPYLNRAADTAKGRIVFIARCKICHGASGEGMPAPDKKSYTYPPLWGDHSYNDGAGMYRIGNLAGYVKNNMPFGATYQNPQLTDEQAWDVAAFVNAQPRPHKDQSKDWPDIKTKPIDFPFGPYADNFSETQHKYGPFKPIKEAQKKSNNKK